MDRLIKAILQLSRAGARILTPESVNVEELVRGAAASLKTISDQRGAEIIIERVPAVVSDRLAVEQILSNLMENAVKYLSPGRPGRIVVSGRNAGHVVEISVADNGRGIDPKDRERVFELFRRAGTQDQQGEGIGLAHVRALARRLGGTVTVKSELGVGSTFTLSLPITGLSKGVAAP
jgi:signal transduction histidine kinase